MLNFSCAKPNVNDLKSLFEAIIALGLGAHENFDFGKIDVNIRKYSTLTINKFSEEK
jgi:hypothetical protein